MRHLRVTTLSKVLEGLAVISAAFALWGGPRVSEEVGDDQLRAATGGDKKKYANTGQSCDDKTAQATTDGGVPTVPEGYCNFINSGYDPPEQCIRCASLGTNYELNVLTDTMPTHPPGLQLNNPNVSCGLLTIGTCQVVNGTPECVNMVGGQGNCLSIKEWFNQPTQGGGGGPG